METLEGTARTVGLFDIGTNSVRLSIVQVRGGVPVVVNQQREMVRLGEGEFRDGELQPESMDRCAAVCRRFRDLVRSYGDGEIVAVATSATRDAANQGRFLARLREEADLDVRVISGREEARLIYLGVVSGLHLGTSRALFVDIGGGSTELVVGTQTQHEYLDTLKLGAIRLSTLFQGADRRGPISEETYQDMKRHVRDASVRSVQRIRTLGVDRGFGSSGTLLNLGEICALRTGEPGRRIPLPCLREVLQDLRGLDLEGLQESLLREAREEGHRVPEPLPEDPGAFWGVPSDAPLLPLRRGSEGPAPLPHRLGNLPFWRSIRPFLPSLETLSVALAAEARRRGEALLEAGPPSSSLPDEPEEPRGGAPCLSVPWRTGNRMVSPGKDG